MPLRSYPSLSIHHLASSTVYSASLPIVLPLLLLLVILAGDAPVEAAPALSSSLPLVNPTDPRDLRALRRISFIRGSFLGTATFSAPSAEGGWAAASAYDPEVMSFEVEAPVEPETFLDDLRGVVCVEAVEGFLGVEEADDFLCAAE